MEYIREYMLKYIFSINRLMALVLGFWCFELALSPDLLLAQQLSPTQKQTLVDLWASQYCSDAAEIFAAQSEPEVYMKYAAQAQTTAELLTVFSTLVHEACHSYNFTRLHNRPEQGYFITQGIRIPRKQTAVFPSLKLNSFVKAETQAQIFRYANYVGTANKQDAQIHGIYGLLEEFSAYYHGTKAHLELFRWMEQHYGYNDARPWVEYYLGHISSEIYAYEEFRLFMAWYLQYAQQNAPEVYEAIIANQHFKVAFTLLDKLYAHSLADYFELRKRIVQTLQQQGHRVSLEGSYLYYYIDTHTRRGIGTPDAQLDYLRSLWTPAARQALAQVVIPELGFANYEHFLR
ncbi:hypothetical protein [Eisenibacter elegans]|uniref:hypothetical protein n=1 Tax=Eisenibacter elegans TaxID=997 RepID=UPI0003FBFB0D|nr:hypothetical protein [Eisenibacter elegans]